MGQSIPQPFCPPTPPTHPPTHPPPTPPTLTWYCTSMQNSTACCTSLKATWKASPSAGGGGEAATAQQQPCEMARQCAEHSPATTFTPHTPLRTSPCPACPPPPPRRTRVDLVAVVPRNELPHQAVVHLLHLFVLARRGRRDGGAGLEVSDNKGKLAQALELLQLLLLGVAHLWGVRAGGAGGKRQHVSAKTGALPPQQTAPSPQPWATGPSPPLAPPPPSPCAPARPHLLHQRLHEVLEVLHLAQQRLAVRLVAPHAAAGE